MVTIVKSIAEVRSAVSTARASGRVVGFVPTMGALHDGHVRLIENAASETDFVAVSIFVNPTQFGPLEDFARYPRTPEEDAARCEAAGTDLIFLPEVEEMYPKNREAMSFVTVPGLENVLEGERRPGHFRGVATVVLKLFSIVRPDIAYFGAKDYQQQLLIRKMTEDLNLPLEIRAVETVRESDGLALSSRNRYLSPDQRRAAAVLWRALAEARALAARGETDANRVRQILRATIESVPEASLDYAEVADAETLEPLATLHPGRRAAALLAVRFGATRLIDNVILMD